MTTVFEREETPTRWRYRPGLWGYPSARRIEAFPAALKVTGAAPSAAPRRPDRQPRWILDHPHPTDPAGLRPGGQLATRSHGKLHQTMNYYSPVSPILDRTDQLTAPHNNDPWESPMELA
jgi:hypothetical protein